MIINHELSTQSLKTKLQEFWELSSKKLWQLNKHYDPSNGSPVFTINGKYSTRGWTEWTQGFQFGSFILQYDVDGNKDFLEYGRINTIKKMALHLSHTGVHDHGFNNISTYGNLHRIMSEGKIPFNEFEKNFYELALKVSAAVQADRWTPVINGGFIYSFNGPHSLFIDTIRTCRILGIGHQLGHKLKSENDAYIDLLERLISHALTTAKYSIFYGEGRDIYDVRGRTAHEAIFNTNDGQYRCVNSQQGYSGLTTWTRGLAWAITGYAELLEFIEELIKQKEFEESSFKSIEEVFLKAACATSDFYLANTPVDGIPYWDTGAPGLVEMGDYLNKASDPNNDHEPIDSSAAAIAAQGLLRLGKYLSENKKPELAERYFSSGLTLADSLFNDPYLSRDENHQGLLLHSIYHRPNGWDHIPNGSKIPKGESSMWGDYHLRELGLYLWRLIHNEPYYKFFITK